MNVFIRPSRVGTWLACGGAIAFVRIAVVAVVAVSGQDAELRAASLRGNRPRDGREKHWRGVESDIPGVNRVSRVLCYRGIANGSRDRACFRNELISRASNWLARGGDGMTQSKQRVFESSRLEEIKVERPFMPRSPISHTPTLQSFLSTKARTHRCSTLR